MQDCWYEEPLKRPTFADLVKKFEKIIFDEQVRNEFQDNGEYLDLSKIEKMKDSEMPPAYAVINDFERLLNENSTSTNNRKPSFPTQTNV